MAVSMFIPLLVLMAPFATPGSCRTTMETTHATFEGTKTAPASKQPKLSSQTSIGLLTISSIPVPRR